MADQLFLCRRQSSHRLYQHLWECYRSWCASRGYSVSTPTITNIADFLLFLRVEKHLSVLLLRGTAPPWSPFLSSVCQSFMTVSSSGISSVRLRPVGPPSRDLVQVLSYLRGPTFEPLSSKPLRLVTMKVSFLLALATAKRVDELQALSCRMAIVVLPFHWPIYPSSWLRPSPNGIPFLARF